MAYLTTDYFIIHACNRLCERTNHRQITMHAHERTPHVVMVAFEFNTCFPLKANTVCELPTAGYFFRFHLGEEFGCNKPHQGRSLSDLGAPGQVLWKDSAVAANCQSSTGPAGGDSTQQGFLVPPCSPNLISIVVHDSDQ